MGGEFQSQEVNDWTSEKLVDAFVRYILDVDGKLLVFENVPARVNVDTGEQFFSPSVVRRIQEAALSTDKPTRTIQAAVYEFAA